MRIIHKVRGLVERGERLSPEDCRELFTLSDLNEFSRLSRIVRERRYGRDAFFLAVEMREYHGEDPELFISEIETVVDDPMLELLLLCCWKAGDTLEKWIDRFTQFSNSRNPITIQISAPFLDKVSGQSGIEPIEVLRRLTEIVPLHYSGEGAGLFRDDWREIFLPSGLSSERWLSLHQNAQKAGLKTEARMAYHTDWDPDLYVDHLNRIRQLQDATSNFISFVPYAWKIEGDMPSYRKVPTASTTLRLTAIARLFLDNVPHIVSTPARIDPEIAYTALSYGADTIDQTIRSEFSSEVTEGSGSGMQLNVIDAEKPQQSQKLELGMVEERISEARFDLVPVSRDYTRLTLVSTDSNS